jgi:alpha-tubulin suppressor-like RCC1 family protein
MTNIFYRKNGKQCKIIDALEFRDNDETKLISPGKYQTIVYKQNGDLILYKNQRVITGLSILGDPIITNHLNIKTISCGYHHAVMSTQDGNVFVFGNNDSDQCGLGDVGTDIIWKPVLLMNNRDIKSISSGGYHTILYENDGNITVFGLNEDGQLGLGDTRNRNVPTLLKNDKDIKSIHCGSFHTIFHRQNGEIIVFGYNYCGQIGMGNVMRITVPTLLMKYSDIKLLSSGYDNTLIYRNNGDILGFGSFHYVDSDRIYKPTLLMNDKEIKAISCRDPYTFIYKNNGDVISYKYGIFNNGEVITNDPSIIQINKELIEFPWSIEHHKYFSTKFKEGIETLYRCLKRYQMLIMLKIPRFVVYEIIKFVDTY